MSTFKSKAFQEITPTYSKEQLEKLESHISPVETLAEKILAVGPQIVLIGEGSHGTREFYENRIDVTKTLIERGLCQAVLIEGDLPASWAIQAQILRQLTKYSLALRDFHHGCGQTKKCVVL